MMALAPNERDQRRRRARAPQGRRRPRGRRCRRRAFAAGTGLWLPVSSRYEHLRPAPVQPDAPRGGAALAILVALSAICLLLGFLILPTFDFTWPAGGYRAWQLASGWAFLGFGGVGVLLSLATLSIRGALRAR